MQTRMRIAVDRLGKADLVCHQLAAGPALRKAAAARQGDRSRRSRSTRTVAATSAISRPSGSAKDGAGSAIAGPAQQHDDPPALRLERDEMGGDARDLARPRSRGITPARWRRRLATGSATSEGARFGAGITRAAAWAVCRASPPPSDGIAAERSRSRSRLRQRLAASTAGSALRLRRSSRRGGPGAGSRPDEKASSFATTLAIDSTKRAERRDRDDRDLPREGGRRRARAHAR